MAFTTVNVRKSVFGDLKVTAGDWTGSAGDANGSLTVEGGRVYHATFDSQDSTNGPVQSTPYSVSQSGSTCTISIANRNTVTTGRFVVIHA